MRVDDGVHPRVDQLVKIHFPVLARRGDPRVVVGQSRVHARRLRHVTPAVLREDVAVLGVQQGDARAEETGEDALAVAGDGDGDDWSADVVRVRSTGANVEGSNGSVDASGDDSGVRHCEGRDGVAERGDGLDRVARVGSNVEDAYGAIVAGAHAQRVVGGEADGVDRGVVAAEATDLLTRGDVPQEHLLVAAARREPEEGRMGGWGSGARGVR